MEIRVVTYSDSIKFSGESELILEDILDLFDQMSWNKDAFISFSINVSKMFQIMGIKENGKFLVEITNESYDMVYHQKYATYEECKHMIERVYLNPNLDSDFFKGFYKVPITTKTLDDIMKENGTLN